MKKTYLVLLLPIAVLVQLKAQNIVQNPGFEAGSVVANGGAIPDWTNHCLLSACAGGWGVANYPEAVHSGSLAAYTGCDGSSSGCLDPTAGSFISQSLTTVPGDIYDLTFWFNNAGQTTGSISSFDYSELDIYWAGTLEMALVDITADGYRQYTVDNLNASSVATLLQFNGRNDPGHIYLDDVTVVDVGSPEPATFAFAAFGLSALAFVELIWRKRSF